MKITRIAFRYSRTVNLGNYESCKVECEMEAEPEDGELPQAVRDNLIAEVKNTVKAQLTPLARLRLEQIQEVAEGLPPELRQKFMEGIKT